MMAASGSALTFSAKAKEICSERSYQRGFRSQREAVRATKADSNIEQLKALQIPAYEQSKNVYRVDTANGAVMYYPTSGSWQHRGRTLRGDVLAFRAWLKKKHML